MGIAHAPCLCEYIGQAIRKTTSQNQFAKRFPKIGNNYYIKRGTRKISEPDWIILTKCLSEGKKEYTYLWDSRPMKLTITNQSKDRNHLTIRISGEDCIYEFNI